MRRRFSRRGKNQFELARDILAVNVELLHETRVIRKSHRHRDEILVIDTERKGLGLLIIQILQAMLELAQEMICLGQLGHGLFRQLLFFLDALQDVERGPNAQIGITAAANQLEDLRDEFDFADAARAEFDVVMHFAAFDFLAQLRMQSSHRFIGAEIEIFAEYERTHDPFHQDGLCVGIRMPGNDAALDPGVPLPFPALLKEIFLQHGKTDCQRTVFSMWPQTHIDPEHISVNGIIIQASDELAPEAGKELMIRDTFSAIGFAIFRIHKHQIDIR